MIRFPHCKINLGLSIIEKRKDGFHELETVFYPVALQDALEIIHSDEKKEEISFTHSGIAIPGNAEQNLCVKAYQLLKKDFPTIPSVKIHLHKNIPMGAGLGGGSSDGAFVLRMLNDMFNLSLSSEKLVHYAAQLGSDCPFFIYDQPYHATGRGEILQSIQCDLKNFQIVLIHPQIHVSTAWAFSQLNPHSKQKSITQIVTQSIETWKLELINDFEEPIFTAHPILGEIKNYLYDQGALYASMSGSGSSLFGIFSQKTNLSNHPFNAQLRIDWV
jgi:4-diphosphocytidyl-2-C-methyl-D-erythritol kinase